MLSFLVAKYISFLKNPIRDPGSIPLHFCLPLNAILLRVLFLVVVDESWIGDSEFHGYRLRRCYCICCCQVYSKGVEITQNSWFCIPVNYIVHSPEDRWQMLVLQSYWSRSIKNSWSFGGLFCEYKQGSRLKESWKIVFRLFRSLSAPTHNCKRNKQTNKKNEQ